MRPKSSFPNLRVLRLLPLLLALLACTFGQGATLEPTIAITDTPIETDTPVPTSVACTPRSDWPSMLIAEGDTLSAIAARTGSTIEALVAANCLDNAASIISGQTLRVPTLPADAAVVPSAVPLPPNQSLPGVTCANGNSWFFNFDYGASDSGCPGPVLTSNAVGQNFQGGRVYRYDAPPSAGSATIFVIYNDTTWATYPDTWDPSQPMDDPSIVPPPNWTKPTGALGKLWREQPGVRAKLGWAYLPEAPFAGRQQTSTSGSIYIDHGFRNYVLRLDGVNGGRTFWTVVGNY